MTNASKLAFYYLTQHLQAQGFAFIDCQMQNPHLQTLGVKEINRDEYLQRLARYRDLTPPQGTWVAQGLTK